VKECRLTLRSSGPPPAGRATLAAHFPLRAASRRPPLSSNVRQHRNVCALPSPHRSASGKTQMRPCCCRKIQTRSCAGRRRSELEPKVKALWNRELEHVQGLALAVRVRLSAQACSGRPSFCGLLTNRGSRSLRLHQGFSLFLAPSPSWSKLDERDNRCVFSEPP
jgi:hypothetical protein